MRTLFLVIMLALLGAQICSAEAPPQFILQWSVDHPMKVTTDVVGNVYVSLAYVYTIQKYSSSGVFLTEWQPHGTPPVGNNGLFGLTTDVAGDVYVSDTYNHRIQKYTSSGIFITEFGSYGSGSGQFDRPEEIAVDLNGNIYVCDTFNCRVQKFTSAGDFITEWGSCGFNPGQFYYNRGIATDAMGNVFVSDIFFVQKFTSSGVLIARWGVEGGGSGQGQFFSPLAAVDASGNVYVVDTNPYTGRIQKLSNTGTYITEWVSHGSGPEQFQSAHGITTDLNGNIYVADLENSHIQKFGYEPIPVQPTTWGAIKALYR